MYHSLIYRNKLAGKRLLGFIPTVSVRTAFRGRVAVGRYRRAISRMAMKFVVQQILDLPSPGVYNFGIGKCGELVSMHAC